MVYIPDIYTKAQNEWVDSFYRQNGYLGTVNRSLKSFIKPTVSVLSLTGIWKKIYTLVCKKERYVKYLHVYLQGTWYTHSSPLPTTVVCISVIEIL